MNNLLTVEEISKILNCKPSSIYSWVKSGKIPALKINGLVRFCPSEVEEWLQKNKNKNQKVLKISNKNTGLNVDNIVKKAIEEYSH